MVILRSSAAAIAVACLLVCTCPAHIGAYTPGSFQRPSNGKPLPASSTEYHATTRRDLLLKTQAVFLSSLLLGGGSIPAFAQEVSEKTIVVTGSNSGIGFEACKRLAALGHTVVLACRSLEKARRAAELIQETTRVTGTLIPAECDLADMSSIKSFAESLPLLVGNSNVASVDVICLNAGMIRDTAASDCARTIDGFELTVGTNHFGHFYLNHLLLPMLARDGKIVVTASSVHDPESPGGAQGVPATLGDLKGLELEGKGCEMIDGNPFNADKAYKDSKLCNVLFTRELQHRLSSNDDTKGISANCFSPGLIVGTGLFRNQNPVFTKVFDIAATNLLKVGETPEWGGACLEYMTTVSSNGLFYNSPPGSSKYGNAAFGKQFVPMAVSKEGQDDAKGRRLWNLSAKVLGIAS